MAFFSAPLICTYIHFLDLRAKGTVRKRRKNMGETDNKVVTILWIRVNFNFMRAACRPHLEAPNLKTKWIHYKKAHGLESVPKEELLPCLSWEIVSYLLLLCIEPDSLGDHGLATSTPDMKGHLKSEKAHIELTYLSANTETWKGEKNYLMIKIPWSSFLALSRRGCCPWNLFRVPWSQIKAQKRKFERNSSNERAIFIISIRFTFFGVHSGG